MPTGPGTFDKLSEVTFHCGIVPVAGLQCGPESLLQGEISFQEKWASWSQGLASRDGSGGPERPHRPRTEDSGLRAPHSQRGDPDETRARALSRALGPRWDGPRDSPLPAPSERKRPRKRRSLSSGWEKCCGRRQSNRRPRAAGRRPAARRRLRRLRFDVAGGPPVCPAVSGSAAQAGCARPAPAVPGRATKRPRRSRAPARPPQPGSPAAPRPRAPLAGDGRWKEETLR